MIEFLLLDLDDTILDFHKAERIALSKTIQDFGVEPTEEALVEKAGGNICGRMAILAEGDAQERKDLIYLEKLPLFHPDGTVME